jgi:Holliday junction resolvase RusA-like endonuclease
MTTPGFDQLVSALVATGTERPNAERLARRKLGITAPSETPTPRHKAIAWPVRIRLPWSLLVSDNERNKVRFGERQLSSQRYRDAKKMIAARVREQLGDVEAAAIPLALEARVWLPDNRKHDTCNFAKAVHDALKGVVFVDDEWLYDTRWRRAGVDVDQPRAEITIIPIDS